MSDRLSMSTASSKYIGANVILVNIQFLYVVLFRYEEIKRKTFDAVIFLVRPPWWSMNDGETAIFNSFLKNSYFLRIFLDKTCYTYIFACTHLCIHVYLFFFLFFCGDKTDFGFTFRITLNDKKRRPIDKTCLRNILYETRYDGNAMTQNWQRTIKIEIHLAILYELA